MIILIVFNFPGQPQLAHGSGSFGTQFSALFRKQLLLTKRRPIATIIIFIINSLVQIGICYAWSGLSQLNRQLGFYPSNPKGMPTQSGSMDQAGIFSMVGEI